MTQPSQLVERRPESGDDNDQEMPIMPPFDVVRPGPDTVRLNVEVAREWAFLGGD